MDGAVNLVLGIVPLHDAYPISSKSLLLLLSATLCVAYGLFIKHYKTNIHNVEKAIEAAVFGTQSPFVRLNQ